MKDKAILIIRVLSGKKAEYDIEAPLNISAYELFVALDEFLKLEFDISDKNACYLCAENPIAFLIGDRTLGSYGIRDGTVINVFRPRSMLPPGDTFTDPFNYSRVCFDRMISLYGRERTTVGNLSACDLSIPDTRESNSVINIIRRDNMWLIAANQDVSMMLNGCPVDFGNGNVRLQNYDFFTFMGRAFFFHNNSLYFDRKSNIEFRTGLPYQDINESIGAMHYPEFVRNSRMRLKISDEPISLLSPKDKPQKSKQRLFLSLLPSVGMLLALFVMSLFVENTGGGFMLVSSISMVISVFVSIMTYRYQGKDYIESVATRETGYKDYIRNKEAEIQKARSDELKLLDRIYYKYEQTSSFAKNFSGSLFDRIPTDDDFLDIRIGTGVIDAIKKIDYRPQEKYEADDDELVELPVKLSEKYRKLENAPILIRLKQADVVGIVGNDDQLYSIMKIMYFDLCIRHHFDEVHTALVIGDGEENKYEWIKWFRHINNQESRSIACDEKSRNALYDFLYTVMNERDSAKQEIMLPQIVVFVMDDRRIKEHPVSKYIDKAASYGVHFLFFENAVEFIPLGCSQVVLVDEGMKGRIVNNENTELANFSYHPIQDAELYKIAYKLAPVYCQEVGVAGGLRKSVSLFEILGVRSLAEIDLTDNWSRADVLKTLSTPLGINSRNELVCLDIKDGDNSHGPHGLVAGTTGSGKSELLMTYILSLAVNYSPHDVAFLIIDFKGGGMADNFETLPHTLGIIRNIDGKEIQRSLISIKAEIVKRQRIFQKAKAATGKQVQDINDYIMLYREGKVTQIMPHLLIIVDEFAELKDQFPDFMEELKSAARIGRTLGVHLILATQRPQGQIDPQIDSNSKFRLCLKVQTPSDSNDIIKSPMAAEIKEAGRAYIMVGNNEIFELFQSAYSGFSEDYDRNVDNAFSLYEVDFAGRRSQIYEKKAKKKTEDAQEIPSQKSAVVDLIRNFCKKNPAYRKLPNICQMPLPKRLLADENLSEVEKSTDFITQIGLYDDPENQFQGYATLDVGKENTLILGSSRTGKTNLLQWIIKDLSIKFTSKELNFYLLDFASMILKNFSNLNHVGDVVCVTDDEKLMNFCKMIREEIAFRRSRFNSCRVGSFTAYRETNHTDLPQIIVVIDNLTALCEAYTDESEEIFQLAQDGISVGITLIAANMQLTGIGYRYLAYFSNKVSLYNNDDSIHSSLFSSCRIKPLETPGRAIVELNKECYEMQTFLAFEGEKEIDRMDRVQEFINAQEPGVKAKPVPTVPEGRVTEDYILKNFNVSGLPYTLPIGMNYGTVEPYEMDFSEIGELALCGKNGKGKGNFIRYIVHSLKKRKEPVNIVLLDDHREKFGDLKDIVNTYTLSLDAVMAVIENWADILKERNSNLIDKSYDLSSQPLLMLIIQNNDFHDTIEENSSICEELLKMQTKLRKMKFCIIYAQTPNEKVNNIHDPDSLISIVQIMHFLMFDDVPKWKILDDSFISNSTKLKPLDVGGAYLVMEDEFRKIKTVYYGNPAEE